MNKFLVGLTFAGSLLIASAPSFAKNPDAKGYGKASDKGDEHASDKGNANGVGHLPAPSVQSVPEIDAANAGLALALIGGLIAMRRERRKA